MSSEERRLLVDVNQAEVIYKVFEDGSTASRFSRRRRRLIRALRGVSFQLHEGESIGIVGRNGSGKSTLLNALTGLQPLHSGRIRVRQRPTLLGVGAALQGSLSGRRNIELGGLALGQTPAEVARQAEAIIEFAELRDFIDLPLSGYSSGMRARLAFSIATASIPEILLVDEALAVGDAAFARRSAERIREIRDQAGAVVLVSHNMEEVAASCDRVIWLDAGVIRADGDTTEVIAEYQQKVLDEQTARERTTGVAKNTADATPTRAVVAPVSGPRTFVFHIGSSFAGTQGVQNSLLDAEKPLAERGYWYPTIAGRLNQYPLVAYATRSARGLVGVDESEWEDWRADFADRFLHSAPEQGHAVASSSHAAAYLDAEGIAELGGLLQRAGFERLAPVLVVRRQDERASQRAIERLRSGELGPVDVQNYFDEVSFDLATIHDRWEASELVDEVDLRLWPSSLTDPTPADHVFDRVGVPRPIVDRPSLLDQLPGVDLSGFEFVRRLGEAMQRQGRADLRAVRFALATMAKRASGELALSTAHAEQIMAHFEDSNRRLAELMGPDAAAYLFADTATSAEATVADLDNAATVFRYAVTEMR